MVEFENDENHAARKSSTNIDATLPSEKPTLHVLGDLSSSLSPSVHTLQSVGQQSTNARKSSPIRAFLTPPLMRKRKVPSSKHLHHDDENGGDSRQSTHTTAGNALPGSRSKSFGFLSLLKVNPRDHECPNFPSLPFTCSIRIQVCLDAYRDPFLKPRLKWLYPFVVDSSSFLIEVAVVSSQSFSQVRLCW